MPRFELSIPPNTPLTSPVSQVVQTGLMEINHEVVRIPKGHAYLTYFQMIAGRSGVVIPTLDSNVQWLRGDYDTVEYRQHIQLDGPQYVIELRGYNLDDTYPHTFYVDLE